MATFHMSGMASGQDTQTIIDAMLKVRQVPITTLTDENTELEADLTAWAELSTLMENLTDALDTLRSLDTWNKVTATSSDESQLTATASTSAAETAYTLNISKLAQAHTIASSRAADLVPDATSTTDLVAGGLLTEGSTFTIEGQTITIGATESLSTLRTKINTAASSMDKEDRVSASILDNRLVIARIHTGDTDISISDGTNSPLLSLNILDGLGAVVNEQMTSQDAEFTVNGTSVTRSSNTELTDVIENVTLNLLDDTSSDITLTVAKDRETPKNAILDFIEQYNTAAAQLDEYGQINVQGESADGATVDSSTLGELYNDSLLSMMENNIRSYATAAKPFLELYNGYKNSSSPLVQVIDPTYTYNNQTGTMDSLDDIGIWTTDRTNKLTLTDETKLDYMLENHFDQVKQLFRGVFTSANGYENGLATDFYKYSENVSSSMTGEIALRTSALQEKYDSNTNKIDDLEEDIAEYEQELWEQFSAMEDTIASLQSDLTTLTSKLGES